MRRIRYTSDDPSPVSLPATLAASVGIITPGDVFEVPDADADRMLATDDDGEPIDPRWSDAGDADLTTPYDGLTISHLRDALGDAAPSKATRAELLALYQARELVNPTPPGEPSGTLPPVLDDPEHAGSVVPGAPAVDVTVTDPETAGDAATDSEDDAR